jgi:hypothetical protein
LVAARTGAKIAAMRSTSPIRHRLIAGFIAAVMAAPVSALDAPAGKVLLTVSGALQQRNTPDGAAFDQAMLEKLPQRSFSTKTPWYPEPRKFTGVLLRDLLAAVGARAKTIKAIALNDYLIDIPVDEALRHDLIVAYLLDDKPVPVREKGPLMLMYPFDSDSELRSALNYSRAVWQLKALELK